MYDLVAATEAHLIRPRFPTNSVCHLYPTEASVKLANGTVLGACLRAGYLRCKEEPGLPHTAYSQQIFKLGKANEDMIIDTWKEMGIFETRAVRFVNAEYNLSGELDCILKNPETGKWFGAEVKTFYGYQAGVGIFGNKGHVGAPKIAHLLQTLIYAYEFKHKLPYFELFYMERGNGDKGSFRVEVVQDSQTKDLYWPKINGVIKKEFSINDIYKRYATLSDYIISSTMPDKEFEFRYNNEKIEQLFHDGSLSQSKYDAWKKVAKNTGAVTYNEYNRPGDWNCSYCMHRGFCWPEHAAYIKA